MSEEKQIDMITELLIDFDEISFIPTTTVPNPEAYAIDWKNKLTKALEGYRKQSEWISVDERLPDIEGTYLVYTDKDNITMDIFCIYPSHGTKFWVGGINGDVTHWMPLPEAPKMKDGAE